MKTSAKYFGLAAGPRPGDMSKNGPKAYLTYDVTHKKFATLNHKIFFRVLTRRLADLFEPLNSSLVQLAEELWHWYCN